MKTVSNYNYNIIVSIVFEAKEHVKLFNDMRGYWFIPLKCALLSITHRCEYDIRL